MGVPPPIFIGHYFAVKGLPLGKVVRRGPARNRTVVLHRPYTDFECRRNLIQALVFEPIYARVDVSIIPPAYFTRIACFAWQVAVLAEEVPFWQSVNFCVTGAD